MIKIRPIILLIVLPLALLIHTPVMANHDYTVFINSMEDDLTGDGIREYIKLQGDRLSPNSEYYTRVWADIKSVFTYEWMISLPNGYFPELNLIDLTHDGTVDLFYKSAVKENKQHYHYQLYTLKNNEVKEIPLPKRQNIHAFYNNNFKYNIQLSPGSNTITEQLPHTNEYYINENLYNLNGELLNKAMVNVYSISKITPVLISKSKGYGLNTIQEVRDINDELLGKVHTLWYYTDEQWIILKTEWKKQTIH